MPLIAESLKADGQIDFTLSAEEINCRVRAFANWPGTWFNHNENILKVGKLSIHDGDLSLKPGQRESGIKDALVIGTGTNAIDVLELQKPGGNMVPVSDFLRICLARKIYFFFLFQSSLAHSLNSEKVIF